jgi:ligand-binding SRPBCC domain-containing protein
MPIFEDRFRVPAEPEAVSFFHFQPGAIQKLTPPPVVAQVHSSEPLAEGSRTSFTLWFGPLPVRWLALHQQVDPSFGFTDVQERGPMQYWRHTHHWEPSPDHGAVVHERIEYEHRPGPRGMFTRLLFSTPALRLMFAYRRWAMRRWLRRSSTGETPRPS